MVTIEGGAAGNRFTGWLGVAGCARLTIIAIKTAKPPKPRPVTTKENKPNSAATCQGPMTGANPRLKRAVCSIGCASVEPLVGAALTTAIS